MKHARTYLAILVVLSLIPDCLQACMWDRDTLAEEKKKSPEMAELIFGTPSKPTNAVAMQARIESLRREPKEQDADWWNDLAGAYLRLEQPAEAAKLLEPVIAKFPDNYGMHANLGTAYHLLGRYQEAEREIRRDLELNPEGHWGLEKYHLALLQYLTRDATYQKEHVYVDEFSTGFTNKWEQLELMVPFQFFKETNNASLLPAYRSQWNLAEDTNLNAGVRYMASLNPKEPSCFVMLGVTGMNWGQDRDLHLAMAAFEKAIGLGSPQEALLRTHIAEIQSHINFANQGRKTATGIGILLMVALLVVAGGVIFAFRRLFASPRQRA